MNDKKVVIFLPWLRSEETISICGVNFIPLKFVYDKVKSNIELIRHVDAIIEQYKLDPYVSVKDAVICTVSDDPFSLENEGNFDKIQQASKVLAVSSIAKNEYFRNSTIYVNSSCFELIGQRFTVGDYHVAFISRRKDGSTADAGYSYDTILTNAPPWIRQCKQFEFDRGFIIAMESLYTSKKKEFNRLLLSFEWFLSSFTDNPSISLTFEVVALIAAYDQSHQSDISPNLLYKIFYDGTLNEEETWRNDIKSRWYKEFRDKRDAIIHGSMKRKMEKDELFIDIFIGTQMLILLWKRLLRRMGYYQFSNEDIDTVYRIEEIIDTKDLNSWNDRLKYAKRRALRELLITEEKNI